ncbi:hypothetical protein SDRG_10685 [Saprolegnia diclina VS20]|uniref:Bestrophin homolog n=1 Tax=Saprolegnia diclina (strain VS20) TaxID=1156394 RepID=T0QA46_SAPDV|nr:hypothetical protein SDRG_10685 [Saprolegnia diclina VS20]EQC31511.1 hypothetical protein SDRG_10685 [Saprolegnia diclina VS20]|eukprot:XP_008614910.1 hypothetical protein SDRG_10685 [Saprolegnia diclina VS20]
MIYYNQDDFFRLLARLQGSAFRGHGPTRAVVMALVATVITTGNYLYDILTTQTKTSLAFIDTLTVFNVFIGLMISFRLNSAFNQWRAGVVAIASVAEAARGIVASTASMLDFCVAGEDKLHFMSEMRRLVCLYVSILVQDARGFVQNDIQPFIACNLLRDSEADEMRRCGVITRQNDDPTTHYTTVAQANPHKLRATIVEVWIRRVIQAGGRRGWFAPPQAASLNGNVSTLVSLYTTVYNIANIPIPFNYAHFLTLMMVLYLVLYTFVIVQSSGWYTPLWVFLWGFVLFSCDDLAREIECPFGLDQNDIDLEVRIARMEEELDVILRSLHFHEAYVRPQHLSSLRDDITEISSTQSISVCVDSKYSSHRDSIHSISEDKIPSPEIPMSAAPMLRMMLLESSSMPEDVVAPEVVTEETIPISQTSSMNYGSSSKSGNPMWL